MSRHPMRGKMKSETNRLLMGNVGARVGAMVALGLATIVVARIGGADLVGTYALLRVVPGLIGVLASAGLPGAVTFFLAEKRHTRNKDLRPTVVAMTLAGGLLGLTVWVVASPALRLAFFRELDLPLVTLMGLGVFTQLMVTMSRSCAQGTDDLRGANIVLLFEEAAFLPVYAVFVLVGFGGPGGLVVALIIADVLVAVPAILRLRRRGFFEATGRARMPLAKEIAVYGVRAQVGGVMTLLNLRLDFAILGALAGPTVLGGYAVASKYAELLRLVPLACTYVLYPRFARADEDAVDRDALRWIGRATVVTMAGAVPLALAAGWVLPTLYGHGFDASVGPARVLLIGLAVDGAGGVVTAYLYGRRRPGTNSIIIGGGVLVTVVLDAILIGTYGSMGAAVASTVAYLITTALLVGCFFRISARRRSYQPVTVGGLGGAA